MRYRYYFCNRKNQQLVDFLDNTNIRYKVSGEGTFLPLVYFNLWSTTANVDTYMEELERMKVNAPIVFVEYNAFEIKNAKLLWILPKKQCIDIINSREAYRYSCEYVTLSGVKKVRHEEQQSLFSIAKEPSTKTQTAFWTISTGFSELFTDRRVYELVNTNSLSGIDFKSVMLKDGNYSEKLYQATTQNVLKRHCIGMGYGEKIENCHICGKEQFVIDNTYQLHLNFSKIEEQSDLYVTERIFGQGIAFPLYVISQRFYQLLKQNDLAGGITISPVAEI